MWLQNAIKHRLESDFKIFNTAGQLLCNDEVRLEFDRIKSYLFIHKVELVAIKLKKDYHYMLTMLACMELGVTYIPMKDDYPADRVNQIHEDAPFDLLITEEIYQSEVRSQKIVEVSLPVPSKNRPMYIIFTSGSTGRPKGVSISRDSYENFYKWSESYFDHLGSDDHFLQITEFTFDISLVDVGIFLSKGVHLYFSNFESNIFKLAYEIESYRINATSTVPNNINMLLNELLVDRVDLSSLHTLIIGGARLSWGLYQKLVTHFTGKNVYNLYGPTEFTIYSHIKKLTFSEELDSFDHNVSIGKPILNSRAIIHNDELLLSGIQLMNGYVNNVEKTGSALECVDGDTFYKTGDIAFQGDCGEFFITGRTDDTIKTRGYRVNLLDIDSYIQKLGYVQDCISVSVAHEALENEIFNFLILNEKEAKTEKEIKHDLGQVLLAYQVPSKIILIDKFPVNNSGKVCKKQLKEML